KILKANPDLVPIMVKSPLEALLLVNLGSADAYIDSLGVVSYEINKNFLTGVKVASSLKIPGVENLNNLHVGVRKDWPLFASVMQKALDSITPSEKAAIKDRWLLKVQQEGTTEFELLSAEKVYLKTFKVLKLGVLGDLAPIQFFSQGSNQKGIVEDHLTSFESKSDVRQSSIRYKDVNTLLSDLKKNKVNLVSLPKYELPEDKSLVSSKSFTSLPLVIVTNRKSGLIRDLSLLEKEQVAMTSKALSEKLSSTGVTLKNVKLYKSVREGLDALASGDVKAYCGDLATVTYTLQLINSQNLVISKSLDQNLEMVLVTTDKHKELISIINRFAASIPAKLKTEVEHKWLNVFVDRDFRFIDYWKEIIVSSALFIALLLGFVFWNRSLSKEISERLKVESSLVEARERAEKSDAAKSEFLAMMSHEIRTPLNGIIGMSQILEETELDPDQRKQCKVIVSSGSALLAIINDILDFSKIEAGKMTIEAHTFQLNELMESIVDLYSSIADDKGLKLFLDYDSELFTHYKSDEYRLRQVLLNLVSNSIKFTESGTVTIKTKLLNTGANEEQVRFSVNDTGIGIPEGAQQKLFQKFTQADLSTTRKYGGTGLGLSICKKIVELLGGEIAVKSESGKGSSFYFDIDLPKAPVQIDSKQDITEDDFKGFKILLVEDNRVNQQIAKKFLETLGVSVDLTENGQEAVNYLKENKADLVFMDCHMPVMDGFEATQKIREDESLEGLFIIALTANVQESDKEKCIAAGMNDFLTKPFTKESLRAMVKKYALLSK
ncbi:MAG: ATP-binding protein, partial [Lentisphaeraceae bacterium]|nr:ATP-binding protein [Lentisphaeraceae bacterium]